MEEWCSLILLKSFLYGVTIDFFLPKRALYSITTIYIILSGLWGVAITDFIQFFIALGGAIILLIYAVSDIGGVSEISSQFNVKFGDHSYFAFFPINNPTLIMIDICKL